MFNQVPTFMVYLFIPVFFEGLIMRVLLKKKFPWSEGPATIFIGLIEVITTGLFLFYIRAFFQHVEEYKLIKFGEDKGVLYWSLVVVTAEFVFYLSHCLSHHIRWFWNEHRVHHSSREMNLFVGNRNGWTFSLAGMWIFSIPFVLLGFDWQDLLWGLFGILNYQFFIHTEMIRGLGPLEYVLNTPSLHRVHHATQDVYLDKNFGGVTLLFDVLFGTLQRELPEVKPEYGLRNEPFHGNPLLLVFGGWLQMARDFSDARTWREKFQTLFSMKLLKEKKTPSEKSDLEDRKKVG
jgi:sterol desaturase/sphingolipid hydroxylase (fatty acid hydroxylase superfamily)